MVKLPDNTDGFYAVGTELTVRLLPPPQGDDYDAVTHFQACVTDLFDYALRNCRDSDMVGLTIRNEINIQEKAIGIRFRRKDQLSEEVIWSVFNKVAQSNARFNALDKLVVLVHSIKMPVVFGKQGGRSKGKPLANMVNLKRSIIEVKTKTNCLAHALIITIARITKDPNFIAYRRGIRYVKRFKIYYTQQVSVYNTGGVSQNSRDSKITFQSTESSCMEA